MRTSYVTLIVFLFLHAELGHSQQMFGAGVQAGLQACPYPYTVGRGAVDEDDEVQEKKKERDAAKKELKRAKAALKDANDDLKETLKDISDQVGTKRGTDIEAHYRFLYKFRARALSCSAPVAVVTTASGPTPSGNPQACPAAFDSNTTPATIRDFIDRNTGLLSDGICAPQPNQKDASAPKERRCIKAIAELERRQDAADKAQTEFEEKDDALKQAERAVKRSTNEAKRRAEDGDEETTEAGNSCPSGVCRGRARMRQPSTLETILGGVAAIGGGALMYQGGKYAVDQNTRNGWPSNPAWAVGPAMGLIGYGLSSMTGGVGAGSGAFACNGYPIGPAGMTNGVPVGYLGAQVGGAFGYNQNMFGAQIGGGMWNNGMYPGAMLNPYASMYNPAANMMNPMSAFNPQMGQYPYAGGSFPGTSGFPGLFPGSNPNLFSMYPGAGGYPGGGGPNMLPYPGGYPGGYPGAGGFPGAGGYSGANGIGGMQMQMQMMQSYMQSLSQYYQNAQTQVQNYMYQQQTIMSLTEQRNRLDQQIAYISMGASGGYLGGSGPSILPYPGTGYNGYQSPLGINTTLPGYTGSGGVNINPNLIPRGR